MEQDLAVIRIEQSHGQTVDELSEVYTVKSKIWKAAGMEPMGGCLCIGCLERRLGRMLRPKDFMPNHPFNSFPGTERLLARRDRPARSLLVERVQAPCWTMSVAYIQVVPTINLTADELAAVTAAIRRAIEDDRFPHAQRLDPPRAALGKSRRPQSQPRSRRPRRQLKPTSARGDNRRPGVPP